MTEDKDPKDMNDDSKGVDTGDGLAADDPKDEPKPQGGERRLERKLSRLEREKAELQKKIDDAAAAEKSEHEQAIDKARKEERQAAEAEFAKKELAFEVKTALQESGVKREALAMLAQVVMTQNPDLSTEDIPDAVADTIKLLDLSPSNRVAAGTGGSPSGPGATGDNPWTKARWNLSRQWAMEKQDPAKAAKMAAAAGSALGAIKPPG